MRVDRKRIRFIQEPVPWEDELNPTHKTVWGDPGVQKGLYQKGKVIPRAKEQES